VNTTDFDDFTLDGVDLSQADDWCNDGMQDICDCVECTAQTDND
jgi:hypothetical protein